jgi:murein DD-endopeptidase MepM/ murein hydrolase activator NlpD
VGARRPLNPAPAAATLAALLAGLLQLAGCATGHAPMHPETPPGRWVVVGPGETLALIAQAAAVPAEDILESNGLARADEVKPGMLLFVLAGRPPSAPPAEDPNAPRPALRWPLGTVPVALGSPFGARWGKPHEGIDLPAPIGTPVFAAADGRVVYAGNGVRGYGNLVVIKHAGDLLTAYAHNSMLLVTQGQPVRAGDRIALVGQSGHATGPHLHFEVRSGQIPRDPMSFLPPLASQP